LPQLLNILFPEDIELCIWHVTENIEFFSRHQEWYEQELSWIQSVHPKKRMEYLASRYLLYDRLRPTGKLPILKNEFGKLQFLDNSQYLSISHSGDFTAYIMGPKELGLDIQVYDKKILRILKKFLDNDELEFIAQFYEVSDKIRYSILLWCAKEAVYKAHGKRGIQFNTQIKINFNRSSLESACLYLQDETIKYQLNYEFEKEFIWLLAYHHLSEPSLLDFM
jgi:4'-phosphopantetheinyl transferase